MRLTASKKSILVGGWMLALSFLPSFSAETEPLFPLADPGTEEVVNYDLYGSFEGIGTAGYRYVISDRQGLAHAAGEGVFPNETSVLKDNGYRRAMRKKN